MISSPKVSVITIFLNEERFLQEAIESILAQTADKWELLLIDDGSKDKSAAIAQEYARQYTGKIRYLEHKGHRNRGMSASRNLGIQNSCGAYISFLDADDVWLPHKLEQQVGIMEAEPEAAFTCGRSQWWYSWTGNPADVQRDFVQYLDVALDTLVYPPTLLVLFLKDEWASLCDVLVRREIVEAVGGFEESFQGMYEDQAFHAKLCLNFPAFVSGESWYLYRQHPKACTSQSHRTGLTYSARRTFLNWLEKYLLKQSLKDTEVWHVVQNELRPYRHPILSFISWKAERSVKLVKNLSKHLTNLFTKL